MKNEISFIQDNLGDDSCENEETGILKDMDIYSE